MPGLFCSTQIKAPGGALNSPHAAQAISNQGFNDPSIKKTVKDIASADATNLKDLDVMEGHPVLVIVP